jgi:hypothetical protein
MPDLKTELQEKVLPVFQSLKFDDDDGTQETHVVEPEKAYSRKGPNPTVSITTFDFIKANPAKYTSAQVGRELAKAGYNADSVASLISQMLRIDSLGRDTHHRLYAIGDARKALPPGGARHKQGHTKVPASKPAPAQPTTPARPATIDLEALTLRQLRDLYNELKTLFGDR